MGHDGDGDVLGKDMGFAIAILGRLGFAASAIAFGEVRNRQIRLVWVRFTFGGHGWFFVYLRKSVRI